MEHNFCLLLMITAGIICQLQAQGSTIKPIRHSLPFGGRQSFDGSLPNGRCTSVNDDGDICNLQDGGTSVLVDNTILPLNGTDGDWARDLYTVERPSGASSFISIGFDFGGTSGQVKRVELVLFNCGQRSIRAGSIQIYADGSREHFPLSDPTSTGVFAGGRLFGVGVDSCDNIYRVCVPLQRGVSARFFYIVFPSTSGSNRVYLAETIFYNDTRTCGLDTFNGITGQANTSLAVSITERPSLETSPKTSPETSPGTSYSPVTTQTEISNNDDTTSTELPCQTILIAVITTAIVLSTIIVVALHIPLYVSYRRLISTTDVTSRNTGATMPDNNDTDSTHDYVYMESTALKLQENDAYGTSQIMRREACT